MVDVFIGVSLVVLVLVVGLAVGGHAQYAAADCPTVDEHKCCTHVEGL